MKTLLRQAAVVKMRYTVFLPRSLTVHTTLKHFSNAACCVSLNYQTRDSQQHLTALIVNTHLSNCITAVSVQNEHRPERKEGLQTMLKEG